MQNMQNIQNTQNGYGSNPVSGGGGNASTRSILGAGPGPEFRAPGAPTQPGANYTAPPAMVTATMAAQMPAANPTRVPLGGGNINRPINPPAYRGDLGATAQNPVAGPTPLVHGPAAARSPIQMPGPEAFGLAHRKDEMQEVDWTTVRRQMRDLGVKSFQQDDLPGGKSRLTCQLQLANGTTTVVEGLGTSEKEAVENCLNKIRQARPRN